MTGLPAEWFGFPDRGVLRKGAYADLVVFDPESVNDVGDFVDPARPARGIKMVMVNGTTTWRNGRTAGPGPWAHYRGRVSLRAGYFSANPWPFTVMVAQRFVATAEHRASAMGRVGMWRGRSRCIS